MLIKYFKVLKIIYYCQLQHNNRKSKTGFCCVIFAGYLLKLILTKYFNIEVNLKTYFVIQNLVNHIFYNK